MVDLNLNRELNRGFGNAMSTAVELTVTPAIMGFLGWRLDLWLHTGKAFALFLFLFTVGYVSWKQFSAYGQKMDEEQARITREQPKDDVMRFLDLAADAPVAPPVEREIAFDMAKHARWIAPLIVLLAIPIWGTKGASSAAVAIAVVLTNFLLAAISLSWAAARSLTLLMAVAFGGFLARMGLLTVVVLLVRHQPWIDLPALAVTILATHLGLLFWELRYVSASLAYPGLKPRDASARVISKEIAS